MTNQVYCEITDAMHTLCITQRYDTFAYFPIIFFEHLRRLKPQLKVQISDLQDWERRFIKSDTAQENWAPRLRWRF